MASLERCQPLLGTFVEISLRGDCSEDELLRLSSAAFAQIRLVDEAMSFHRPDSELSELNRNAAQRACLISPALREVLAEALWLSRLSGGLFDVSTAAKLVHNKQLPNPGIRVDRRANWEDIDLQGATVRFTRPLLIDLGGIAKGYAVDQAMQVIPEQIQCTINAGGDLRMNHWQGQRVGIRIPGSDQLRELPMCAAALASSVSLQTRNDVVIIDPRCGSAVEDPRSYSVFASTAMRADGLTKIAVLGQRRGDGELLRRAGGIALIIDADGEVTELSGPTGVPEPQALAACS